MAWGAQSRAFGDPQSPPPSDTPSLSLQGPAGLEGLDGKDGKPGLRVRLWGSPGAGRGAATLQTTHTPPPNTPNPYLFLPRVTPAPLGHQG